MFGLDAADYWLLFAGVIMGVLIEFFSAYWYGKSVYLRLCEWLSPSDFDDVVQVPGRRIFHRHVVPTYVSQPLVSVTASSPISAAFQSVVCEHGAQVDSDVSTQTNVDEEHEDDTEESDDEAVAGEDGQTVVLKQAGDFDW
jgi:hypothetical protein